VIASAAPASAQVVTPDSAVVTPARPDTVRSRPAAPAAPSDSTLSEGLTPDEAAILTVPAGERRVLPPPGRFDQPHWVMLRSLAIPGWGQQHNGAWLKMGLIGGADAYLRVRVIHDQHELNTLSMTADATGADLASADQAVATAEAQVTAATVLRDSLVNNGGTPEEIAAAEAALRDAQTALLAANLDRAGASNAYNTAVIAYNALLDKALNRRWLLATVVLYSMIDAYVDAHFRNFDTSLQILPGRPGARSLPDMRLRLRWKF
jgi:hypothetical protein